MFASLTDSFQEWDVCFLAGLICKSEALYLTPHLAFPRATWGGFGPLTTALSVVGELMKAGSWWLCLRHSTRHDLSEASPALGAPSHLQQHGRAFPSERSPIPAAALHPTVCFTKPRGIQGLCELNLSVKFSWNWPADSKVITGRPRER